jgi:hypothetical protein
MKNFQKYLSTAPVLLTIWMTFPAGFIIDPELLITQILMKDQIMS